MAFGRLFSTSKSVTIGYEERKGWEWADFVFFGGGGHSVDYFYLYTIAGQSYATCCHRPYSGCLNAQHISRTATCKGNDHYGSGHKGILDNESIKALSGPRLWLLEAIIWNAVYCFLIKSNDYTVVYIIARAHAKAVGDD